MGVRPIQRRVLEKAGLEPPLVPYVASLAELDAND